MSKLRTFRIDGGRVDKGETEFLIKVEDDKNRLIGTFDLSGDGLYYYRVGSQIMSPRENENSRESYDGYVSCENLIELFDALKRIGWTSECEGLDISIKDGKVLLELTDSE